MKRILLNSQGILDIQDPRKFYIMKSLRQDEPDNITYSTPFEICESEWFFIKINLAHFVVCPECPYFIVSSRLPYLQYLLERSLKAAVGVGIYTDELYQFDSMLEFRTCYEEGVI